MDRECLRTGDARLKSSKRSRRVLERSFAALATAFATLFMTMSAAAAPVDADRVAAIFPPWWSGARSVDAAASAGDLAGAGAHRSILIVSSSTPGLNDRLRRAGALFVLSPGLAGLCDVPVVEGRS